MGLSSVFSTAITGLTAAETTIDVVGNNIANSNTIGFKASQAFFATQFLQTLSLGAAPTSTTGGTNPRQIGLGTQVAAISPDFTQGTIEISSSASDLAIQGDGFFVVQGASGERLYTRNGSFEINAQSQLVTRTGELVLGFGIDSNFQVQQTELVPLQIPLGSTAVAKATENVFLQGTLTPTGNLADTAKIIQSGVLGNSAFEQPAAGASVAAAPGAPSTAGIASASANTGTTMAAGTYQYKIVFADGAVGSVIDTEGLPSVSFSATVDPGDNAIDFTNLPVDASVPPYSTLRIYRTEVGGTANDTFHLVGEVNNGTTIFTDDVPDADLVNNQELNENLNNSTYSYYVTYYNASRESRPSPIIGPQPIIDGALRIEDIPLPTSGEWTGIRIYRNTDGQDTTFYRVADIADTTTPGMTYTDKAADADIIGNPTLDFDGPKVDENTLLVNVVQRTGATTYTNIFEEGVRAFTVRRGRDVRPSNEPKELVITATTRFRFDRVRRADAWHSTLAGIRHRQSHSGRWPHGGGLGRFGTHRHRPDSLRQQQRRRQCRVDRPVQLSTHHGHRRQADQPAIRNRTTGPRPKCRGRLHRVRYARYPIASSHDCRARKHEQYRDGLSLVCRFGRQRPGDGQQHRGGHRSDSLRRRRQLH